MKTITLLLCALWSLNTIAHEPAVVLPGDVENTPFPGHQTYLLADHNKTTSKAAILEIEIPARTFGAPPHVHTKEDEHFYVISGNVEFLDREQTISTGPGSLVILPRGHLHGFWNLSEKPAKMLLVVTPGEFASFFDAVVAKVRKNNADNPAKVGKIITQVAEKFGVSVYPNKVPDSAKSVLPN